MMLKLAEHLPVPATMDLDHPAAERYSETIAAADHWFGRLEEKLIEIGRDPRLTDHGRREESFAFLAGQAPTVNAMFEGPRADLARSREADAAYLFHATHSGRLKPPEDGIKAEDRLALEAEARAALRGRDMTDLRVMYLEAARAQDVATLRVFEYAHPVIQRELGLDLETLEEGQHEYARGADPDRYARWEASGRVLEQLTWAEQQVGKAFDALGGSAVAPENEPVILPAS